MPKDCIFWIFGGIQWYCLYLKVKLLIKNLQKYGFWAFLGHLHSILTSKRVKIAKIDTTTRLIDRFIYFDIKAIGPYILNVQTHNFNMIIWIQLAFFTNTNVHFKDIENLVWYYRINKYSNISIIGASFVNI